MVELLNIPVSFRWSYHPRRASAVQLYGAGRQRLPSQRVDGTQQQTMPLLSLALAAVSHDVAVAADIVAVVAAVGFEAVADRIVPSAVLPVALLATNPLVLLVFRHLPVLAYQERNAAE